MTEAELTLAIFMMECFFLFCMGFVGLFGLAWRRRRQDIQTAAKLVSHIKGQEVLAIEKLRMQMSKTSRLDFEQTEKAAKKIVAKQHLLMAEITELFLNRDQKRLFSLPEKLNAYTQMIMTLNHRVEQDTPVVVAAVKDGFTAKEPPKSSFAKQFEELIAD